MNMDLIELYVTEMPKIQADEKMSRFEDMLMTNENLDNRERQKYVARLQAIVDSEEVKKERKMNPQAILLQMATMGLAVEEVPNG